MLWKWKVDDKYSSKCVNIFLTLYLTINSNPKTTLYQEMRTQWKKNWILVWCPYPMTQSWHDEKHSHPFHEKLRKVMKEALLETSTHDTPKELTTSALFFVAKSTFILRCRFIHRERMRIRLLIKHHKKEGLKVFDAETQTQFPIHSVNSPLITSSSSKATSLSSLESTEK